MQDFAGQVAVVTAAASGTGLAFAERFARQGMRRDAPGPGSRATVSGGARRVARAQP